MDIHPITARHTESNTASLHIRTAETSADWQLAHTMLDEEHLLGAGREAGDRLCQFILQEDHTDYYLPNQRPKKLWLKPLVKNAFTLLCTPELPEDCKAGLTGGGGTHSPLKVGQLKTLRDAFRQVPDPRRPQSRRHPLSAMLTLVALGLLMGGRDMLNIWRRAAKLDENQRAINLILKAKPFP